MTKEQFDLVFDTIRAWPDEDQEELLEAAREIEARHTGLYVLSDDEKAAIEKTLASPIASDDEVAALWKRLKIR
ncbi:MAG TPA: hypothetical protein VGF56_12785 [Rhizomicrobium sp.]|jgi:hypothetical protein